MICKKCGNELKMGSKFCYSCGYYVDEEDDYEDDEEGSKKKKKKKKNGEPKLSFKEKWAKKKEEKQLAKEAKIRQKEIEAEEKEREKMAAEYEKEQKIKDFYKKEQEAKIRAERKAKALEEKERERELERHKKIDDNYKQKKTQFDDALNNNSSSNNDTTNVINNSYMYDEDDENANFSYGTESLINRSPGLGFETQIVANETKDESDLSFDDFNVENRYKKITGVDKSSGKKGSLDLSYDDYKQTNTTKKKSFKSEASKYMVVIIASVVSFVVIFALVYGITNSMASKNPEPTTPVIVEDITVLLGNCTISIPGNLNYNVDGNNLYVAYDDYNLSFTISKDNYDNYSSDLTKLSNDFEKRNYTVSSSDKRDVNGKEYIVYKIIVNGSSKYFYLTKVKSSYVAMGMIEMNGNASVDEALQSISKIIFSVKM